MFWQPGDLRFFIETNSGAFTVGGLRLSIMQNCMWIMLCQRAGEGKA